VINYASGVKSTTMHASEATLNDANPYPRVPGDIAFVMNNATTGWKMFVLGTDAVWRKVSDEGSLAALTSAPNVVWDLDTHNNADLSLTSNVTIQDPINRKQGKTSYLALRQRPTGFTYVTWGPCFQWAGGVAPTLSTSAFARDQFTFFCDGANMIGTMIKDVR
jgi:hypothetical protein